MNSSLYTYLEQKSAHYLNINKIIDRALKRTHLLQTIAVVPIPAVGVAQFGSMQKVSMLVSESNFYMMLKEKAMFMIMVSFSWLLEQSLYKFA